MSPTSPARARTTHRLGRASALVAAALLAAGTAFVPEAAAAAPVRGSARPAAAPSAPNPSAPTPSAPAAPSLEVVGLRLGDRGRQVKVLQRALIGSGILIPGGADGIFGTATDRAVRWFQRNNGLGETGVVDEAMARGLELAAPEPATGTTSSSSLARGSRGERVRQVQQALQRAGITVPGGADGIFGPATTRAVKRFQRAKGLFVDGIVGPVTGRALGIGGGSDPAPSAPSSGYVGLKLGSSGERVAAVQRAIMATGLYLRGGADGQFGLATQNALMLVQRTNGIPSTGVVDAATASALRLGTSSPPPDTRPSLRRGARGTAVKALQQALMAKGVTVPGGADGIFGPATESALRSFQRANGLSVTGVVDSATAKALGLDGSGPPPSRSVYVGLKFGSTGEAVKAVQRALMATGITVYGGADGVFGAATRNALMLFQRSNGLTASGIVDAASAKILGLSDSSTPYPTPGTTAPGYARYNERGARVVALQMALMRAGVSVPGGADGSFGSGTAGAVIAFQRSRGLSQTGKVDQATANALDLDPMPEPSDTSTPTVRLDAKPVQGPCWTGDTWLAPRGGGRLHLGTDIIAARGQRVYAVTTGRITQIYRDYPGSLAGNGLKIARPDGTYFFYAHLARLARGIGVGTPVSAGQVVGYVGSTGNAATPHLHLEVHPGGGAAINPYPIVTAIGAC